MAFAHSPKIVTDGLVLALDAGNPKSYPGSGTIWRDKSGNGNDGTLNNGPTFSSDNGGAIVFDGTNDHITLATTASLNNFTATIVAQVDTYRLGWAMFFGADDSDSFIGYEAASDRFRVQDLSSQNSDLIYNSFNENALNMIQVVQTGNDTDWYLNGSFIGTSTNGAYNGMHITKMVYYSDTNALGTFAGKYHTAHLYNRALSASEVQQNYNALKGRFGL